MKIISKQGAIEQGLTRYFTGKPCKHGHVAERYVSGGMCSECRCKGPRCKEVQKARKEGEKFYFTGRPCKRGHIDVRYTVNRTCRSCKKEDWESEEFKERRKQYNRRNEKHKKRKAREHYEENKEVYLGRAKEYRINNPEWYEQYHKEYYWENRDHLLEQAKEWGQNNKARRVMSARERKEHIKQATPAWADQEKILFFYECCPAGFHVDHIVPLRGKLVCGLHNEFNLQWLPAEENIAKGNKFNPETFA